MINKRQVMYDIGRCVCHVPDACRDCSYFGGTAEFDCMEKLMFDALALLKEQDAVEPVRRGKWLPHPTEKDWRVCSACGQGTEIVRHEAGGTTEYNYKHCPWCGAWLEVSE